MHFNFAYLAECLKYAIHYLPVSLKLAFIPFGLSLIFGTIIAMFRFFKVPVISKFFNLFIPFYTGIPVMVELLIYNLIYLTLLKPVHNGPMMVAYFTFTIGRTCAVSETIRGGFEAIPKGQYESSYACGLTFWQTMRRIIVPQLIPVVIPTLTNSMVGAIKNTSIVLVLGINDVLNGALIPCNLTYSFLEGYVAAAIVYWILGAIMEFIFHKIEKALSKNKNGGKKK